MRQFLFAPLAAALFVAASPSHAALTLKLDGWSQGANGYRTVTIATTTPALNLLERAGQFVGTVDGASFTSYCIELTAPMSFGVTYTGYTLKTGAEYFSNAATLNNVGRLFSEGIVIDNADKSAAFQLALWELTYETSSTFNVLTGTATFNGRAEAGSISAAVGNPAAVTLANQYLSALAPVSSYNVFVLQSATQPGTQDLIYATPVPEPTTVGLLAAGLAGMGALVLRRRGSGKA